MAEENKTPAIMPWPETWELKPRQALKEVIEKATTALEGVKTGKMPWDMDWKEKPRKEAPKPVPMASPTKVNVRTEADMRKAMIINPNEVQPDTRSAESNLAEIDAELSKTKDPLIIKVLNEERKKYAQKR